MPLDYMLRVMRDPNVPARRRDEMAKAVAPYLHARLAPIESPAPEDEPRINGIEVVFTVPRHRAEELP
jgi:hypothetical protein